MSGYQRKNQLARKASHAGSWYNDDPRQLDAQLSGWMAQASVARRPSRAIISPHAGYDYSGHVAAHAFNQIVPDSVKRIFILGPSHYLHLAGKCSLATVTQYSTPFYELPIDQAVYTELKRTGEFDQLPIDRDEEEHSIEMQLPYIAKVMERQRGSFAIVPVLVGLLSLEREATYGRILAPYLIDPGNIFVISSDFCHWGHRFQYTHYNPEKGEIWQSIKWLDEQGMQLIEDMNADAFNAYLKQCGNTICGQHPIGILLQMTSILRHKHHVNRMDFKFVKYAQSERCRNMNQSSVSYAAGSLQIL
ncbi:putative dioxygenase [Fasciola hepatica]|uniref:Dioxygenase n=1 Tax=Fasciola hepatica TaxID=6192 RepID=A0A4E0RZL8_FASHE|nr:putative dioxygenase [Fasciola hepatica]